MYHTAPASFDTPENVAAATIAQDYGNQGYFGDGYLGKTAEAAIDEFNAGKALYFLQGTYFSAPIVQALGDGAEMILVPGTEGGPFSVTGGPGTAFGDLVEVARTRMSPRATSTGAPASTRPSSTWPRAVCRR